MKNRKQHLLDDHDKDSMNLTEDMAPIDMATITNGEEVNDVAIEDDNDDEYIDDDDNDSIKIDKKDDVINEATSMDVDYDNVNNSEMATDIVPGQKRKANAISEDEHQMVENEVQDDDELADRTKAARAHSHHFLTRAPMVPYYIAHRILQGLGTQVNQRNQFVKQMCKYWALKREMRRGAPLLKRLHLEVG